MFNDSRSAFMGKHCTHIDELLLVEFLVLVGVSLLEDLCHGLSHVYTAGVHAYYNEHFARGLRYQGKQINERIEQKEWEDEVLKRQSIRLVSE